MISIFDFIASLRLAVVSDPSPSTAQHPQFGSQERRTSICIMESRFLARALRTGPTPVLLRSRQVPQIQSPFLSTLRYNSSKPSSQSTTTTTTTKTETETTVTEPAPNAEQPNLNNGQDLDALLNKLDLGSHAQSEATSEPTDRRALASNVAKTVNAGGGYTSSWRNSNAGASQLGSRKLELKLGPTLGRQVHVEPERGVDLAAAIRNLGITVSANKIKQQSFQQKFHTRKGMVRKEQRRTRWRKLFRFSFQETVKKIQRMQAQGW